MQSLKFLLLWIHLCTYTSLCSQVLQGKITDSLGHALSYASVYLKGSSQGTIANKAGIYFLELKPGVYTIVAAHVGYQSSEKSVRIDSATVVENFILPDQVTILKDVVISSNSEDPAYTIIRKAISARPGHLDEISEWQAMVYMKGLVRTFHVPRKILGVTIDPNRDIIDTSGKGIIYFSESLTKYSRKLPDEVKEEVISAKVSGVSQGFGFNSPSDVEVILYENNISLPGLNSRGFISPIADNALYFYRYKYLGTFYENGREVNKIQVIPKRAYEPCFAGYINILEDNWRIHSFDLLLTRQSQMEVIDSVRIVQQQFPVDNGIWMPQQTNILASFTVLGLRAAADFTSFNKDYKIGKLPDKIFKSDIVKVIDTAANKKSFVYWNSIRPVPLTDEERLDYIKKDSLERKYNDPHYLDSLDKRANKWNLSKILLWGTDQFYRKKKLTVTYPALVDCIQYNTVEGWLVDYSPTFDHWADTGAFVFKPHIRYGFSSKHFNAAFTLDKTIGKNYRKRWDVTLSGGKYIFQINSDRPIRPFVNTFSTLLYKQNYMKIYENIFGGISGSRQLLNGFSISMAASYEDRIPLENTDTTYSWSKKSDRSFTSNYPEVLPPGYFVRHQALLTSVTLNWQPGQKFVQYPDRLVSLGSDKPLFTATFTKAWAGIAGSDASFGKWMLGVRDEFNMKLGGSFIYHLSTGGFINNGNVQLPDWQHFNGNLSIIASDYVNSFQVAPYYANSTKDNFFATANLEWHLNGLLSNKIPLVKRWNLGFVTGTNAFYVDKDRNHFEFFAGIENLFKTLRIDFVWAYDGFNQKPTTGVVLGFSGILTGQGVD